MGGYEDLKDAISAIIRTNDNQEITGATLQSTLLSIINIIGQGATFKGVATPSTNPGNPDGNVFYIAGGAAYYSNFGLTLVDGLYVLENKSGSWVGTKIMDINLASGQTVAELSIFSSETTDFSAYTDEEKALIIPSMLFMQYILGIISDTIQESATHVIDNPNTVVSLLKMVYSPIVLLDSMGSSLDGFNYTPVAGDLVWRTGYVWLWNGISWDQEQGGIPPKKHAVYINKHTGLLYIWNGNNMVDIGGNNYTDMIQISKMDQTSEANIPVGKLHYIPSQAKLFYRVSQNEIHSWVPNRKLIYIDISANIFYRWQDSSFQKVSFNTEVVNDLTTGGERVALSAEMGKQLHQRLSEIEENSDTSVLDAIATIDNKLIKPSTEAVGAASSLISASNNSNKVTYFAITGGKLNVSIGTGPKTTQGYFVAFAKRLSSTVGDTQLYLAATNKCTSAGVGADITLENYSDAYKYLFIGHFEGSVNVVEETTRAVELNPDEFVKREELEVSMSASYTEDVCTIAGEFIRTTGLTNTNASFKRSDYIDISDFAGGKLTYSTSTNNSSVCFAFYDADHDVISVTPTANQSSVEYDVPLDAKYVRFSIGNTDIMSAVFQVSSVKGLTQKVDDISQSVQQLQQTSLTTDTITAEGFIKYNQDDCTVYGAYPRYSVGSSGEINDSSSAADYRMSDFMPVYGGTYSFSKDWTANSSNNAAGAVFYDKNKARISSIRDNATDATMPDGAAFVRIAVYSTSKTVFICSVNGLDVVNRITADRDVMRHYNVLCIGNSFCSNLLADLPVLMKSLGFSALSVYNLEQTGTTIANRWNQYVSGSKSQLIRYVGVDSINMAGQQLTIKESANYQWDYIILQMFNTSAGDYTAYALELTNLVSHLRNDCPNKNVRIGVHMEWPRGAGYGSGPVGLDGYTNKIAPCAKSLLDYKFIDFIIPTGTAVMNAAFNTTLNTDESNPNALFLKDQLHLAVGVGRYLACCSFWETIMRPLTGISITESRVTIAADANQVGSVALTNTNRYQAHAAVLYAISNPFMKSIMTFDGMEEPTTPD